MFLRASHAKTICRLLFADGKENVFLMLYFSFCILGKTKNPFIQCGSSYEHLILAIPKTVLKTAFFNLHKKFSQAKQNDSGIISKCT